MENSEKNFCPVRDILDRISDKWSILVLLQLKDNGTMRFNALHRAISDVSQKMLTVTLRTLEADGLVSRKAYAEVPPRVEYCLTEVGDSLLPHIRMLADWALANKRVILNSRGNFEKIRRI